MKTFSHRRASRHRATISWLAGWDAPSSQSDNFMTPHLAITLPSVLGVARPPELLLIASHSGFLFFSHHHRLLFLFLLGIVFSTIFMKIAPLVSDSASSSQLYDRRSLCENTKKDQLRNVFDDSSPPSTITSHFKSVALVVSCLAWLRHPLHNTMIFSHQIFSHRSTTHQSIYIASLHPSFLDLSIIALSPSTSLFPSPPNRSTPHASVYDYVICTNL